MEADPFVCLSLRKATPLCDTKRKLIFAHPSDRRLLVKIVKSDATRRSWGIARAYKRLRRSGIHADLIRMLEEDLVMRARLGGRIPFLQRIFGTVDTDMGIGLVVEKIVDRQGEPAPSVAHLTAEGRFTREQAQLLSEFLEQIARTELIVNDLKSTNILYGTDEDGSSRFVLVDGFGEKSILRLCSLSRSVNAWNTARKSRPFREFLRQPEWQMVDRP